MWDITILVMEDAQIIIVICKNSHSELFVFAGAQEADSGNMLLPAASIVQKACGCSACPLTVIRVIAGKTTVSLRG